MIINATKRRSTKPGTGTIRALQARESREAFQAGEQTAGTPHQGTGWTVLSYLISGMAAYGGIGWLIGRATHIAMLFPIGMLAGLAISIWYVIYRYGVQASRNMQSHRKESDR